MSYVKLVPVYPKSSAAKIFTPEEEISGFEMDCACRHGSSDHHATIGACNRCHCIRFREAAEQDKRVTVTPIEPTDAECEDFVRQAWKIANQEYDGFRVAFEYWHNTTVMQESIAIARHALKQLDAAKGTK